ncbi:MAG: RNA 2',3'-cyclic phosphodiesterase [Planctomycetota bacterium]|nr:RNA 2',3'-cyclic phosphodiesterase [Planctomycetota bacterium]
MNTIRSFISIPLAKDVLRGGVRLLQRLSHPGDGIKWVPTDNFHLTLKFLGEVDNTEVPNVCEAIREICQHSTPFELSFAGTGAFPDISRARVVWVGIDDPSGELTRLATELDKKLADLGFKRESRDYTPHLTLGRTKSGSRRANPEVIERLQQEQDVDLGIMQVSKLHLMASFLDKQGPTYHVMDTIELV